MISSVVESHNNNKKPRKTRYAHTNFKQNGEESWIINYTKTKTLKNNKNIKQQQQEQKNNNNNRKIWTDKTSSMINLQSYIKYTNINWCEQLKLQTSPRCLFGCIWQWSPLEKRRKTCSRSKEILSNDYGQ